MRIENRAYQYSVIAKNKFFDWINIYLSAVICSSLEALAECPLTFAL